MTMLKKVQVLKFQDLSYKSLQYSTVGYSDYDVSLRKLTTSAEKTKMYKKFLKCSTLAFKFQKKVSV